MNAKYNSWISSYVQANDVRRRCDEATALMHEHYPELVRVRGFVIDEVI